MTDELKSEKTEAAAVVAAAPENTCPESSAAAENPAAEVVSVTAVGESEETASMPAAAPENDENDEDEDDDDHREIVLIEKKEKNRTLATSEEYENFVPKFSEDNMPKLDSELRAAGITADDNQSAADLAFAAKKAAAAKEAAEAAVSEQAATDAAAETAANSISSSRIDKPQKTDSEPDDEEETHVDNSAGDEVSAHDKLLWHRTAARRCRQEITPLKRSATIWYAICMLVTFIVILYIFTLFSRAGQDFGAFFNMIGGTKNLILLLAYLFLIYFVRGKNRKFHLKEAEYEKLCRKLLKKLDEYVIEHNENEKFKEKFIKETEDKYKISLRPFMIENADMQRSSLFDRFKKK